MKKVIVMLPIIILLIFSRSYAYEMPLDIKINSDYIKADAFIENSVSYIKIRDICQALNIPIEWNDGKVTINNSISFSDNEELYFGLCAKNIEGSVYVPARYIGEIFDFEIEWDSAFYTVTFFADDVKTEESFISKKYTYDEVFWLARIIEAESGCEPEAGKIAVGNVILNRVASKEFPNTIYGVIFDNTYSIQFEPVMNGSVFNSPSFESVKAAKLSLSGYNEAGESLYFMNPRIASNNWIAENREFFKTINNHDFYL